MRGVPRLFIDASVWIAAAGSSSGGSGRLLSLCMAGYASAVCSRLVLREAERNIRTKLPSDSLLSFFQTIGKLKLALVNPPSESEVMRMSQIIDPRDAHVLASALAARVDALLTLDRKHFFTQALLQAGLPFKIMTPGDFIRTMLG